MLEIQPVCLLLMPAHSKVNMSSLTCDVVALVHPTWKVSLSLLGLSLMSSMGVLLIITSVISRLGTNTGLQKQKGGFFFFPWEIKRRRAMLFLPTKFALFLPLSHHSVHKVGAVWRHCKAADSCCGVHEVAVSKYSVMRCCISSNGEHSHCERVAGGVLWWNSLHLVPPKQTQTFHFRWTQRVLFIHLGCICCGALLEEGFEPKTSSWYLSLKATLCRDKTPSGLLMLYFEPGAFWSEATGLGFVWSLAI